MYRYENGQLQQLTMIIWRDIDEIFVFCGLLRVVNLIAWALDRLNVILCEIFEVTFIVINWIWTVDTYGSIVRSSTTSLYLNV
jgi:hypothetical protein